MRGFKLFVLFAAVVAVMAVMGPALAQQGSGEPDVVQPTILERNPGGPDVAPGVAPGVQQRGGSSALPFTGSDIALFVLAGGAAIGAGVLVLRTRKAGASA